MDKFKIVNIRECMHHLPLVLLWYRSEWGDWSDEVYNSIFNADGEKELFVVLSSDDCCVGVAGFAVSDLPARKDLSQWLVGVYVHQGFRGKGLPLC